MYKKSLRTRLSRRIRNLAFVMLASVGLLGHAAPAYANLWCGSCADGFDCTFMVLCAIQNCCGWGDGHVDNFNGDCTANVTCTQYGTHCDGVNARGC